jgi:ATP-dependent Zn protease
VAALLAYCEAEAAALIRANIEIVHALVEALIERGTLTGDEIDTILARAPSRVENR